MLDAVRILTAALIVMGVAQLAPAQPVEYDLAIDAAASLSDPGPGGELSAFAPLLYEDDHLFFGDFRVGGIYDEFSNLSFGWGQRHLQPSGWIVGSSFYLDVTQVNDDDEFAQLGIGLEWLSIDWDVRINGYLADGVTYYRGPSRAVIRNNTMLVEHPLIGANSGTDFEIGYLLGDWKNGDVEWRGYLGGYYFGRGGVGFEPLTGPRVRTELRLFDVAWLGIQSRIVAAGQYQWDEVRGSQGLVSLFARVTLGTRRSGKLSRIHRRMVNPVVRQPGAVTSRGAWTEGALTIDGDEFGRIGVVTGRTANPTQLVSELGEDSIVILSDSAGPIDVSETFELNNGQAVLGGTVGFALVGEQTGVSVPLEVRGQRPLVRGIDPDRDVFRLAQTDSIVAGVDIEGGRNGIVGSGTSNYTIFANRITGAVPSSDPALQEQTGNGIFLDHPGRGGNVSLNLVEGNTVGINVRGEFDGNLHANSALSNQSDGIRIDGNLDGALYENQSSHNGGHGFFIDGWVAHPVNDNVAAENAGSGIHITKMAVWDVSGNTLTANGGDGIRIEGQIVGSLKDNTATENGGSGIAAGEATDVWNNVASRNGEGGIALEYALASVHGNTAHGNGRQGILLYGVDGDVMNNDVQQNGLASHGGFNAGLHIVGDIGGAVRDNVSSNNRGAGIHLELNSGENLWVTGNMMQGNNSGGAEFVAEMRFGQINTSVVRLRENISKNIVPAGAANYERLDPQIELVNKGGNTGIIGD